MSQGFVNLTSKTSSWADRDDAAATLQMPKTWGTAPTVKAISIADQLKEDEERRSVAPSDDWGVHDERPLVGGYFDQTRRGDERGSDRGYRGTTSRPSERAPREKLPIPTSPPYTAFIGNLSFDITEDDLGQYFEELRLVNVRVVRDESGRSKGFAYIEFENAEGLSNALTCDGIDFGGRRINVDVAAPREQKPRGDRYGGGSPYGRGSRGFGAGRYEDNGGGRDSGGSWRSTEIKLPPRPAGSERGDRGRPRPHFETHTRPVEEPMPRRPSGSDPFAGAADDISKMDKLAEERLRREQEKEEALRKRRAELDDRRRGDFGRGRRTSPSDRYDTSWGPRHDARESRGRGAPRPFRARGRGGYPSSNGQSHDPSSSWNEVHTDEEGFQTRVRRKKSQESPSTKPWNNANAAESTPKKSEKDVNVNPFGALTEESA